MLNDRRKFIVCSGMAVGGALMGKLTADQGFTEGESAEADVVALISRYGKAISMTKDSSGVTQVKAKLYSNDRMAKLLTEQHRLPLSQIRTTPNNTFEFEHRGKSFSISHQI